MEGRGQEDMYGIGDGAQADQARDDAFRVRLQALRSSHQRWRSRWFRVPVVCRDALAAVEYPL